MKLKQRTKRVLSIVLAAALFGTTTHYGVSAWAAGKNDPTEKQMVLWYDEPATRLNANDTWQQATLPIGNGILGANVYGELGEEHLTLNEETLWSGGRGSVSEYNGGNPSTSKEGVYNELANYYLNGTSTGYNVEQLAGVSEANSGYAKGYQALGDLYFSFENAPSAVPTDYVRMLDLENGISTVAYSNNNVEYTRTYFASNPDNVIVARFTASGNGNLNFTTRMTSKQNGTSTSTVENNKGTIVNAGAVSGNNLLHNTQIYVEVDEGTVTASNGTLIVSGANVATVYLTSATDYKNVFYEDAETEKTPYYYRTGENADQLKTRVGNQLKAAANKGYDDVFSDHKADYQELYNRVNLDLGQSSAKTTDELLAAYKGNGTAAEKRFMEVLMFQYGRYLLISGSRENSQLPTNLQGIWNNSNTPPWGADIHTNINEQMNYWLSNNCNLTECALPLVRYMASLKEPGGKTVKVYTGSDHGIMAHTQNTPFGYTSPGWKIETWGWSPAAATWLLQNCYDYYQYSGDTDTLSNVLYPVLKEQVLMYEELLKEKTYNNGVSRKVMPITQSPEIEIITAGNAYEQSLIWQLYADTIEAAKILEKDSDLLAKWQQTMDKLKPIEIGSDGQVKEWYHETTLQSVTEYDNYRKNHRHLSNLLGLYPGDLFDTEEEIEAAKVSLAYKNFGYEGTSVQPQGGWTYGQLIGSWARVGNGENAYYSVSQMIKNKVYNNLWDWHDGGSYGLFQIDANYGYSAGVGEMLLQSNLGYINPLPALPEEWAAGSVDGLLAEGGFEVDMDWTKGTLDTMKITSKNGGRCAVKADEGFTYEIKDASENTVKYDVNEGVYAFDTTAGSEYTVKVIGPKEIDAAAARNADGSVTITWDFKEKVTYTIKRKTVKK